MKRIICETCGNVGPIVEDAHEAIASRAFAPLADGVIVCCAPSPDGTCGSYDVTVIARLDAGPLTPERIEEILDESQKHKPALRRYIGNTFGPVPHGGRRYK